MQKELEKKTVLVGLGGTGSKIVQRVRQLTQDFNQDDVAYVCFDTNKNDIGKINDIIKVKTSEDITVGKYLKDYERDPYSWFPKSTGLESWKLLDGAKQTRVASRLALRSAILSNSLTDLTTKLNDMMRITGNEKEVQIIVISSIAGGTGSGIVLQMPNLIRSLFFADGTHTYTTRGIFLLPDIFKPHITNEIEKTRISANAYATIRELNAMNKLCYMDTITDYPYHMNINYFDNDHKILGNTNYLPYGFVFTIDKENTRGLNIPTIDEAINETAQIIKEYLFSPMTADIFSLEDNLKPLLNATQHRKQFSSAAVSKIIYPYEDNLNYVTYRLIEDMINDQWRKFDIEFDKEFAKFEQKTEESFTPDKPERKDFLIKGVEADLSTGTGTLPFLIGDLLDTRTNSNIVTDYYSRLKSYINSILEDNEILEERKNSIIVDSKTEEKLKDREKAVTRVTRLENNRRQLLDDKKKFIKDLSKQIAPKIIDLNFIDEPNFNEFVKKARSQNEESRYNILSLLTKNTLNSENFIHPISVRYSISKLIELINIDLVKLKNELSDTNEIIDHYDIAFDIKETPKKETARDLFKIKEENTLQKLIHIFSKNNNQDNIEKFKNEMNKQASAIEEAYQVELTIAVLNEIKEELEILNKLYTDLFINLKSVTTSIQEQIDNISRKNQSDTFTQYIAGSIETKNEMYREVKKANLNSSSINKSINEALFEEASKAYKNKLYNSSKYTYRKLENLFDTTVLDNVREKIKENSRGVVDFNVIDALFKDSKNNNFEAKRILTEVFNRAQPLISHLPERNDKKLEASALNYWGMNPDTLNKLAFKIGHQELRNFFEVPGMNAKPTVIVSDDYSPYEITSYNALYILDATQLNKINTFKEDYDYFVDTLREDGLPDGPVADDTAKFVTPHLDKKWHITLPHITEELNKIEHEKNNRGILLSLIYGDIRLYDKNGNGFEQYYDHTNNMSIKEIEYHGKELTLEDTYDLYLRAQRDPFFTTVKIDDLNKLLEKDRNNITKRCPETTALENNFVDRLTGKNLDVNNILEFVEEIRIESDDINKTEAIELLEGIDTLINEYVSKINPERERERIRKLIKKEIYSNSSFASLDINNMENRNIQEIYRSWAEE